MTTATSRLTPLCVAIGLAIALAPAPASAQVRPPLSDGEVRCARTVARAFTRFTAAKSACVRSCIKAARKTAGPYLPCLAPIGGAVGACVNDPQKGAAAKARAAIARKCTGTCPPCAQCADDGAAVDALARTLDVYAADVYCVERHGGTPTAAEATCEDAVAKALVKLVVARTRCFDQCNARIRRGKLPEFVCRRPEAADETSIHPFDPTARACLAKADATAAATIDEACGAAGARPACHGGADGAARVAKGTQLFDANDASKPDGTPCDDGKTCTADEFCYDGSCVGATSTCPSAACTPPFPSRSQTWVRCDLATGTCDFDTLPCRTPSDPCYDTACHSPTGICITGCATFECGTGPDGVGPCKESFDCSVDADCDDGNICTSDDCSFGLCSNHPITCFDGDRCTRDTCHPDVGCILRPFDPDVCPDDGIACTQNVCSAGTGCEGAEPPRDHACDDGNPCTVDRCDPVNGAPGTGCAHEFLCDDGDGCTLDGCDLDASNQPVCSNVRICS